MNDNQILIAVMAFSSGVVSNIVRPKRRGIAGFFAAALIGVWAGAVAALLAIHGGFGSTSQLLSAAAAGLLGDKVLTAVLLSGDSDKPTKRSAGSLADLMNRLEDTEGENDD